MNTGGEKMTKLAETVRIQEGCVFKHPNADLLDVIDVYNNNLDFALSRRGEFSPGDMVIFISSVAEALAPVSDPRFAFLTKDANSSGFVKIKNKRLRGIISRGLLLKADPDMLTEDEDVSERLGLKKCEDKTYSRPGFSLGNSENSKGPDHVLPVKKYDIESLGKLHKCFSAGERVILTEKIHGANCCFTLEEEILFVRSRSFWKKSPRQIMEEKGLTELTNKDAFWVAIETSEIEQKLLEKKDIPISLESINSEGEKVSSDYFSKDFIFWGEVYGQVQDLTYGLEDKRFILFDVFSKIDKRWLNWDELVLVSDTLGIERVPVLYDGEWKSEKIPGSESTRPTSEMYGFAEGDSVLAAKNGKKQVREGFVIRPAINRSDYRLSGRVILKWVGNGYLTR